MKLKDIFNIDLSTRGGVKLYRKIMGKYNIPIKDVKEVKQEIVECSQDGGNTNYKYYLIDNTSMNYLVGIYSTLTKYKSKRNGEICIASTAYAIQNQEQDFLSCRVNLNDRMYEKSWTTIFDLVNQLESMYGKLTEITEEEFYNLNVN